MGIPDPLQPRRVGVGHGPGQERIVGQERTHPALAELQDVGAGREKVDDVEAGQAGVQAPEDGPGRAPHLSRLGDHDVR